MARGDIISKLVVAEAGNFPDLAHFYLDEVVYRVRKVLATEISKTSVNAALANLADNGIDNIELVRLSAISSIRDLIDWQEFRVALESEIAALAAELDLALWRIGQVVAGSGEVRLLDADGQSVPVSDKGFDHFGHQEK